MTDYPNRDRQCDRHSVNADASPLVIPIANQLVILPIFRSNFIASKLVSKFISDYVQALLVRVLYFTKKPDRVL